VTRDGRPVALLTPLAPPRLSDAVLYKRWATLPPMDPEALRREIDAIIDQSLWTCLSTVRGVLDTNTIIFDEQFVDGSVLPSEPLMTTVTLAELSVGPLTATNPREQAIREVRLQQVEADFHPLPFDAAAARAFGHVSATLHRKGQKSRARAFDALIASTAIANDLPLFTCGPADFAHIDNLDLRSVPRPGRPVSP
jgi:tRNA(fMet)-specific endonuclease VapC